MTYYVSPTGGDGNPGTPGLPLQTLAAAVDRSRSGNGEKEIVLLAGEYENTRVALDSRDSGLTIRGEGGPVLRGGIRLYGWEPCAGDGGLYSLALPAGFAGSIRMLEINGRLRQRSRYPREGFLLHNSAFASNWISTSGGGWDVKPTEDELRRLEYDPEVLPAGFDWDGAELTVFHKWDETLAGVSAHDPEKRLLTLSVPCTHPPGAFGVKKFVVWNTRFGMEPGCWRLGTGGKLLYRPFPGEDMRGAAAYIPLFESVITIEGDVAGLTIRDVAFMTTASPERPAGFGAAKTTGAADSAARLEDCVFSGLSFRNAGGWGLRLHGENKNVA
ncbi:MAG: hypothetical protein FWC55_00915, partial [Firmicutes bacterium]|nr:hypothetical protein [Bacillota bacterium]